MVNLIYNFVLYKYLTLSLIVFLIGIAGIFITRRNIILILISIELILLSVNLLFIFTSVYVDDIGGQFFALLVLTIAASESAIGLALIVIYFRLRGSINVDLISSIKG